MLNNIKIGTKLYISFGFLIILLLGVTFVGWLGITRVDNALGVTQHFGLISDNCNQAMIQGRRAIEDSTLHIYAHDAVMAASVQNRTANVMEHLNTIITKIGEDTAYPDKHQKYVDKTKEAIQTVENFRNIDNRYEVLQKNRDERNENFHKKYLDTGTILGKILEVVDAPHAKRIAAAPVDGDISFHFFKMNKAARDCRGALTAFKISYDGYMLAIGEKAGSAAREKMQTSYEKYDATIKAFDAIPFDAEQQERIKQIRQLADGIKADVDEIAKAVDTQNDLVEQKLKEEELFTGTMGELTDMVDEIYSEAETFGNEATARAKTMAMALSAVALFASLLIAWRTAQNITPGIVNVARMLLEIEQTGDLTVTVQEKFKNRRDEIGELAKAFTVLTEEFRNVEHLAQELAGGNWDVDVEVRGERDVMNIHLAQMIRQVNTILLEVEEVVANVASGTQQLAETSSHLSDGATETAASVEEISASVNEIGSQTKKNADNADSANKLARHTNAAATAGQEMMQKMIGSMQQITANAGDIHRVVKVIDDISFQTNLLALNAAVEAARAGAHGKGFAVVAEEVRNLASRSAKAAAETTQMIDSNSTQIQSGAGVAEQTASTLVTIVEQASQVAGLIGKIAEANQEQASAVEQVSHGLQQIESVTQRNTATAEKTAAMANEISGRTRQLQELMVKFRLKKESV